MLKTSISMLFVGKFGFVRLFNFINVSNIDMPQLPSCASTSVSTVACNVGSISVWHSAHSAGSAARDYINGSYARFRGVVYSRVRRQYQVRVARPR